MDQSSHAISVQDANTEIQKFLTIREELQSYANQMSEEARNFVNSNALSFVFYKDQLDAAFNSLNANAFRVYFAATASGSPTLVIYPSLISNDEYTVANQTSPSGGGGQQYPKIFGTQFHKGNFNLMDE